MAIVGLAFLHRVRRLASVMSLADAFKFAFREEKPGDFQICLSSAAGEITLRGATTDVSCFEKVFIWSEYSLPFDHSPPLVIVDAGANVGMATLYFANRYPTARILAMNPNPKI